jgi:protein-disulfide isomerase
MQAGARAGVSGTPAMFVNGIFISGAVPYEQIAQVIDEELARKGVEN